MRSTRALVLLPWIVLACAKAEPEGRSVARVAEQVPAVRVGEARSAGVYRAAGTVRAARRVELSTRVMGRIEAVNVRAGARVREGQVLLTIERASLTAARQQAAAALELATSALRRTERLYADSAATLVQLEGARHGFAQAEAQLNAVRADLAYADLRAPFSGVVASRMADPGDLASPGRPLLVVEDRGAREIVVTAPDELRGALRVGQEIAVAIGTGERRISARILAVVPGADPQSPTAEVRLSGPPDLSPGLSAVADLPAADRVALLVPRSSLTQRGQLQGVYLFAPDSTLRLRWVRVGRNRGDLVEVLSGLRPDDLVALDATKVRDALPARPVLGAGEP